MWFCFPRCLVFVLYSYFVICSFPLQVTQLQTQKHSATAFRTAGVLVSTVPIYDEMSQCLLVTQVPAVCAAATPSAESSQET